MKSIPLHQLRPLVAALRRQEEMCVPLAARLEIEASRLCRRLHQAWQQVRGTGYPERSQHLYDLYLRAAARRCRREQKCLAITGGQPHFWQSKAGNGWLRHPNMPTAAALLRELY